MSASDVEYYRARAIEEREQALRADRKFIAEIHLELARLYDAMVQEPEIRPTLFGTPERLSA